MSFTPGNPPSSIRLKWVAPVFGLLLLVHFLLATANWGSGFMIGHEFRQTQTAIITQYIDQQHNFGPYYETPILGKPWAFPLELPVYQWCVVGVMRWWELPDFQAARSVSLACFYLTLPALYLLLAGFRVPPVERLVVLAPLLVCPIYLFYSRSFLIDPMAAMFSAWFLATFVQSLQRRRWWWFGLATVTATLGILIKSVVFAVWLFPAVLYGGWILGSELKNRTGPRGIFRTLGWGVGPVILPYLAFRQWILFTDALKASHPGAYEFTSTELSQGNFGTFSLTSRIDPETWRVMAERWAETVGAYWFIGLTLAVGLALNPQWWRPIIGLTGLWMFGQLAFPYAYAYQDYYFYAGTFFLMMAMGVIMWGLLASQWIPVWGALLLALLPVGTMLQGYWTGYGKMQRVVSNGGSGMTALLRDMLPQESVIMGLGFDWSATIPYYSGHRALMVRDAQRFDLFYLHRAIDDLDDEDVAALLVSDSMRSNGAHIVASVIDKLQFVPAPMLRFEQGGESVDIYISPFHFKEIVDRMGPEVGSFYPNVELLVNIMPETGVSLGDHRISAGTARVAFPMIEGVVTRFDIAYGYRRYWSSGGELLNFHPDAALWVNPHHRAGTVAWRYGIFDDAWTRAGDRTDGVVFAVEAENAAGHRRELFARVLRPESEAGDRGVITSELRYDLAADEILRFSAGSGPSKAFDWAYVAGIEFIE